MIDPEEARRAARDILSGAEYAEPEETLIERAVNWIFERVGDAFATLTGGGPGSVIGWAIVLALGGAAIWLLVRALRVPGPIGAADRAPLRYGTESHRSAEVWLAEAERALAAGDHRDALRCRYQVLVTRLVTGGVVDDVPGRTSGEYRDVLGDRLPGRAQLVDEVTRRFEDVWYGGGTVDRAAYDRFDADCTLLETEAHAALVPA